MTRAGLWARGAASSTAGVVDMAGIVAPAWSVRDMRMVMTYPTRSHGCIMIMPVCAAVRR
eukprot:scaffold9183_cov239-Isochrysis_galbana.AAC.1